MTEGRVVYDQLPGTTAEAELSALANVYAFILRKHQERQRATRPGGPEDARKDKNARTRTYST